MFGPVSDWLPHPPATCPTSVPYTADANFRGEAQAEVGPSGSNIET